MNASNLWDAAKTALFVAGMSTLVAGCGSDPHVQTTPAPVDGKKIVGACVFRGPQETAQIVTANGDIYQVTPRGPFRATVTASLQGGGLVVFSEYNGKSFYSNNFQSGEERGLRIDAVVPLNGNVAPPSPNGLLSRHFAFREAADFVLKGFYIQHGSNPICPDENDLESYQQGSAPHGMAISKIQPR